MYVSITGLRPKGWLALGFWRHAIPCKMAADKAKGILLSMVKIKSIDGVNHTLTVWETREHMVRTCMHWSQGAMHSR